MERAKCVCPYYKSFSCTAHDTVAPWIIRKSMSFRFTKYVAVAQHCSVTHEDAHPD